MEQRACAAVFALHCGVVLVQVHLFLVREGTLVCLMVVVQGAACLQIKHCCLISHLHLYRLCQAT
jgi:hypothetical protein